MNFESSEVTENLEKIKEKVDSSISIDDILKLEDFPQFSDFSELAKSLLPENFLQTNNSGIKSLLSYKDLQTALTEGVNNLTDYYKTEISNLFEGLKGEVNSTFDSVQSLFDILDIEKPLQENDNYISDLSLNNLAELDKLNGSVQIYGALKKTGSDVLKNKSNLSPKQIKQLSSDPEYLEQIKSETLNETLDATKKSAQDLAEDSIHNVQLQESAYMNFFRNSTLKDFEIIAERQAFWANGEGGISETFAKKSSWNGAELIDNYSLAVDNVNILIGDKVYFYDEKIEREAVDVITPSKKLFSYNFPVIGVFFENRKDALEYEFKYKKYVRIRVKRL